MAGTISVTSENPLATTKPVAGTTAAATEALRRLHLRGDARESFGDVVKLDAGSLDTVVRTIDGERDHLQQSFTDATNAIEALNSVKDQLTQIQDLVSKNTATGIGRSDRQQNQKQIDDLVQQVGKALDDAGPITAKVFDGTVTLESGQKSYTIAKTDLATLGKRSIRGRTVSLRDLKSHEALDTARNRRASVKDAAKETATNALDAVTKMTADIQSFVTDDLRPRLADTAEAMEGIFNSNSLGSTAEAVRTATDIRKIMLTTGAAAIAVGAEGWDRQRLLDLLTPSTSSTSST